MAKKTLEVEAFEKLTIRKNDNIQIFGTERSGKWISDLHERGFYGEIDHFFNCIKTHQQQPETSAKDALQTHLLLEKMAAIGGRELVKPLADDWDEILRWE